MASRSAASSEARLGSLLRHYEDAQREQGNPTRWLRTEELKACLEDADSDVKIILVDVRDEAEQRVSVLKGALSPARLDELLKSTGAPPGYSPSDEVSRVELGRTLLVPYCTAGVRSAAFGSRLAAKYPEWAPYIRNGEGIVRATYVMPEYIVDPFTGVAVRRVHVFGETWNLAAPSFETVQFSRWQRLARAWSRLSSQRP